MTSSSYAKYSGLGGGGGGGASYTFEDSIVNTGGIVTLVNDSATPGDSQYYGTNSGGTLGYYSLPTVTAGNLTDAGTDGIVITGGTGAVIGAGTSIAQHVADTSHNGYLASTDWNTFNGKQTAGNYITALTGDVTAAGPGSAAATLATVNTNIGTFASATVNAKGLVTAAAALSGDITTSGSVATLATVNTNVGSFTNASITVNGKGLITAASSGTAGTVTSVSVVSANGLAGTVATATTTPAITLSTSITGILQGNGTAISAATTTGTGSVVLATSPTLVTPALGTPSALVGTNISGTGSSFTAGNINASSNSTLITLSALSLPTTQLSGQVTFAQLPTASLITSTSSTKTPTASATWQQFTGNSIALTVGTWMLFGNCQFDNNGTTPAYTIITAGWYGANGDDTGTIPQSIFSTANITVLSTGSSGNQPNIINDQTTYAVHNVVVPVMIIQITTSTTSVYLDTYQTSSVASNARITCYLNALRLN